MAIEETVKVLTSEISRIFRHLIPGVLILLVIYLSQPSWMYWVDICSCSHLIILSVLSITVGTIWYVVHRFTIHYMIDFLCFKLRRRIKVRNGVDNDSTAQYKKYHEWLSNHIQKSLFHFNTKREVKEYIHFRSTQVHLLFIFSESLFIFTVLRETNSIIMYYEGVAILLSVFIFIIGVIQYFIGFNIDVDTVMNDKN